MPIVPAAAYETNITMYGDVISDATPTEQGYLSFFDKMLLGEYCFEDGAAELSAPTWAALKRKMLLYIDFWGASAYDKTGQTSWVWQPGPYEVGDPEVTMNSNSIACYRMTDFHIERLLTEVCQGIYDTEPTIGGIFVDDFGYHRSYWHDDPDEEFVNPDQIWAPHDGRLGYRSGGNWNKARVDLFHQWIRDLQAAHRKDASNILVNSPSIDYLGPRMWEGYCRWWTRSYIQANAMPGDWIVVHSRNADGDWHEVQAGSAEISSGGLYEGQIFEEVFDWACADARDYGLVVGSSYHPDDKPIGKSQYSLIEDPRTWPYYA